MLFARIYLDLYIWLPYIAGLVVLLFAYFKFAFHIFPGAISRQSGRVTFPQSAKSMSSSKSLAVVIEDMPDANPFKVPPDQDIFMLRDKERLRKRGNNRYMADIL